MTLHSYNLTLYDEVGGMVSRATDRSSSLWFYIRERDTTRYFLMRPLDIFPDVLLWRPTPDISYTKSG